MKKNKLSLTVFLLLLFVEIGLSQVRFQKTYGIAGVFYGSNVQLTSDGGYVIVSNDSVSSSDFDVYLIKTNSFGDTLWTQTYGGSGKDIGYQVLQTSDMGYVITGMTTSFGTSSGDVYLIKTDSIGNVLFSKSFHKTQYGSWGESIVQANDGGYLITGISWNPNMFDPNLRDCYIIRTDSMGVLIWDKVFGSKAVGTQVNKTNDGGFIFSGFIWDGQTNWDWQAFLFKADTTGNIVWRKTFGGVDTNEGLAVQQTSDNGYILVGLTQNPGAGSNDVLLIKTNNLGDTVWTKAYGGLGADNGTSVQQTIDGGYIIAGYSNSFGVGDWDAYIIKTDSIGDTLWTKTYGGSGSDFAVSAKQCADGGFIINGFTSSLGDGRYHTYLIKTDANGVSGCNETNPPTIVSNTITTVGYDVSFISTGTVVTTTSTIIGNNGSENTICLNIGIIENTNDNLFAMYPIPSDGNFTIDFAKPMNQAIIVIYNILGEIVYKQEIIKETVTEIKIKNVSSGVYFVKVLEKDKYICYKLIVEND